MAKTATAKKTAKKTATKEITAPSITRGVVRSIQNHGLRESQGMSSALPPRKYHRKDPKWNGYEQWFYYDEDGIECRELIRVDFPNSKAEIVKDKEGNRIIQRKRK